MGFDLADFHHRHRTKIIQEWVKRLRTKAGEQYARRPREELLSTVSEAFDGNYHVLVHENFSYIDRFINKITRMRLEAGFLLSDVQKAFELYRTIVIPLLATETETNDYSRNIEKINRCLGYTIHRFSDHFQQMHQKKILEHNRRLEEEVRVRTSELKESELKYKTLVEEINDGYFVIRDQVIIFANQAYCRMHGYELEEVLGRKFYHFVSPESRKEVLKIYRNSVLGNPAPDIFGYMRLTKDGRTFPTEILAKVVHYENKPSNIGICRDITERVKMEERMREAERMAYIGQIATSLSHEIRNPLSAVKMNLQILKKNLQLQGNDQRRIDISTREVIRLERILRELLDFAKPLHLRSSPSDINQIVFSCVELLETKFGEKNLSVMTSLDPSIGIIQADAEKLEQVFINLLLNSIEASGLDGKVRITSSLHADDGLTKAWVTIEDEGDGIAEEHISEIFRPFFTTKSRGTGLGLSNAERIVAAHGGEMLVECRLPQGVSFRVCLPTGLDYGKSSHSR
jgi:PAS domain S-box-containing protein